MAKLYFLSIFLIPNFSFLIYSHLVSYVFIYCTEVKKVFDILCDGLSLLFIISGMLFLISLIFIKLSKGKEDGFLVVLKADENTEDLCARVYSAFLEANMFNFLKVNKIVVLDYGVEERVKKDCLTLFENSDILTFVNPEGTNGLFTAAEEIIY